MADPDYIWQLTVCAREKVHSEFLFGQSMRYPFSKVTKCIRNLWFSDKKRANRIFVTRHLTLETHVVYRKQMAIF